MIRLLALAGPAGVGKSTLANLLQAELREDLARWSFADPLRAAVRAIFGNDYRTQEAKAAPDLFWRDRLGAHYGTGRAILQTFGTDVCRAYCSPRIWLYALERRLASAEAEGGAGVVIMDDARFDNEAEFIRAHGGLVVHLHRAGIHWTGLHPSEWGIEVQPGDWVLDLDGPELVAAAVHRLAEHCRRPVVA